MSSWENLRERLIEDLCKVLIKTEAIKFGVFTLSSGKLSSYYIDLRIVPSFPGAFKTLIKIYSSLIKNLIGMDSFQVLAGIPTAGLNYTSVLAYQLKKPLVYVRKEVKEHGIGKKVEGLFKPGDNVMIVDDLITSGNTVIQSAKILREEGAIVDKALVLIDRLEGGKEKLKKEGIRLYTLTDILSITDRLYNLGLLEDEHSLAIKKQVKL